MVTKTHTSDSFIQPVTTYCTADDVADFLGISITDSSKPSITKINKLIVLKEAEIERRTGNAFGKTKTETKEWHDIPLLYTFGWGAFISLKRRNIKTKAGELILDSAAGDKLEIWQGSTNTFGDETNTPGAYEILPEKGEIYLRGYIFTIIRDNRVRITYRYGEDTVPDDIKICCIKMVAIDLLRSSFKMDLIPRGGTGIDAQRSIKDWEADIDKIIYNRQELYFVK